MTNDLLVGAPAIARFLGVSYRQAVGWCQGGKIPSFKISGGKVWMARKSELDAAMRAQVGTS